VRRARRAAGFTQQQLADRANVSVGTIKNLESGAGSTVTTLIRVVRALGREEWIEALHVEKSTFNPLDLLPAAARKR
jgi:transcriptional regulator with XRE-family HTH domain